MNDEQPVKLQQTCLHLRHKMMYVDERQSTPGMVDDSSDTRVFFCIKSQDAIGPDNDSVAPDVCTKGRSCFCRA